ncbi:MAG: response regulator transcription factor [Clostridia bacterium]|nr:response regulator transcription factor [Clostridia bacterium]
MSYKVFLVEDNLAIIKGLKYSLEKNNFEVEYKTNIKEAEEYVKNINQIDLAILDVTLPDGNGYDLFKKIIKPKKIPAIFLTANDEEDEIVKGLNIGAEDYITKPFSTKELLARVNKIILRNQKQSIIKIMDIKFDMDKMLVYKDDNQLELTSLEIKLLHLLFSNINKVVSRNNILDKIWEWTGNDVDDHTVTVYFKRIREKIGTNIIKTVKGIGYLIEDEK